LLDLSRIRAGKETVVRRDCEIRPILNKAIEAVQPAADLKNIQIHRQWRSSTAVIFADPDRLLQVLTNLLSNAMKYTPSGGRIDVRLKENDEGLKIDVEDNGLGISPEALQHIFEPFTRGERTQQSGAGLGLAIVSEIVELHGWRIQACSDGLNRGSRFTITIPIRNSLNLTAEHPGTNQLLANFAPHHDRGSQNTAPPRM
jgi:signal transduction histidine kinase